MLRNFFKRIALLELVTLSLTVIITLWMLGWSWDQRAVGYGLVYAGVVWLSLGLLALLGQVGGTALSAYPGPGMPRSDALLPVSSEERAAHIRKERRSRAGFFGLALTVGGVTLGLGLLLLQLRNP